MLALKDDFMGLIMRQNRSERQWLLVPADGSSAWADAMPKAATREHQDFALSHGIGKRRPGRYERCKEAEEALLPFAVFHSALRMCLPHEDGVGAARETFHYLVEAVAVGFGSN